MSIRATTEQAKMIGEKVWELTGQRLNVDQFRRGMDIEFEHGTH